MLAAWPAKPSFTEIPVTFSTSKIPIFDVEIENKSYGIRFDIGSKFSLTLNKIILDSLKNKKDNGIAHSRDLKGNFYQSPSYLIPEIEIGNLILEEVVVSEKSDEFRKNTTLWNDSNTTSFPSAGTLGRPLLEKTNLLFDFPRSKIIACSDRKKLKEHDYFIEKMLKIPLEISPKGIVIKAETDIGQLRLLLDTGTTVSLLRESTLEQDHPRNKENHGFFIFQTQKFSIGNGDFGSQKFVLYDITPELDVLDGILGMDFLMHHVVYIDYPSSTLYIQNSK